MASPVTYQRGATVLSIRATAARNEYQVEDSVGVQARVEVRDFLIRSQDLSTLSPGEPAEGDLIIETVAGRTLTYTVAGPAGMTPWRYSDEGRLTLRIHTVLNNSASALS